MTRDHAQTSNSKSVIGSTTGKRGHEDRAGRDDLPSPGMPRTILLLLGGDARSRADQ